MNKNTGNRNVEAHLRKQSVEFEDQQIQSNNEKESNDVPEDYFERKRREA